MNRCYVIAALVALAALSCSLDETEPAPALDDSATSTTTEDSESSPPILVADPPPTDDAESAQITGTLELAGDCLHLVAVSEPIVGRWLVLWPHGTSWQNEPPALILPGTELVPIGASIQAGGGYHKVETLDFYTSPAVVDSARACLDADVRVTEVAVIQGGGLRVTERP